MIPFDQNGLTMPCLPACRLLYRMVGTAALLLLTGCTTVGPEFVKPEPGATPDWAVPLDASLKTAPAELADRTLAVCLNMKRDTVYSGLYKRSGDHWIRDGEAGLVKAEQWLADAPKPIATAFKPIGIANAAVSTP